MRNVLFIIFFLALVVCSASIVSATDGFVAYMSNTGVSTTSSPKIRYWNNTDNSGNGSWSNEIELPSAGSPVRTIVLKQSPVDSKIAIVTQSTDGNLDGYICMKQCDNANNWNLTSNIGNVGVRNQRSFDFGFETANGDLVVVYAVVSANTARDLAYKVLPYNVTSFFGLTENYIDDTLHATNLVYTWVAVDSDPINTSSEMLMTGFDSTDNQINAWVWNGTAWGNQIQISNSATATTAREALAVKYATDGSKGMAVGGNFTAGNINWAFWNGAAWSIVRTFDINGANGNDVDSITIKADPASADLQLLAEDSGSDLSTVYWNSGVSTWTATSAFDAGLDVVASRPADFSWLPTGGAGRVIWDTDGAGTTLSFRTCSPQCTAATQTFSTYAGTGGWLTLFRNPTPSDKVEFLGFRLNSNFDIGSFWFNGTALNLLNSTNYGDNVLTADTTVATWESYGFDFRRDVRPPSITFITPNSSGLLESYDSVYFNITANEYLYSAILEWNGTTNYTMNMSNDTKWYYNVTGLEEGFYQYKIFDTDWANNTNITATWNVTIDFPPNITLVDPQNNTLNTTSRNVTFYYNVTGDFGGVSNCSLIIDDSIFVNMSASINETATNNITYLLTNGQHNWSVFCNDTYGFNSSSETRNITIKITPVINSMTLDDGIDPSGQIMLNAGSTRYVNCTATASDPEGVSNIINATGKFYYYLNASSDSDDNTVHYSNNSCSFVSNTSINKTFECGFNVLYYANNGTWNCNVTVYNNYSIGGYANISTVVQPLYAVNLTDGVNFGNAASGTPSLNITANITNFGNMPVNMTVQGYAVSIGDDTGMNCSDGKNITITNIKFSTNKTADYAAKISMNGSIQLLKLQVKKQFNTTQIFNTTYWQVNPDPGTINRICTGWIIFSAEAP